MARSFEELGIDMSNARVGDGGHYRTLCPNCSSSRKRDHQKERCLSVHPSKGVYHCFNCDFKGALDGRDWRDMQRTYEAPSPLSFSDLEHDAILYFANRGIGIDTLNQMKVVAGQGVIRFPYYLNGEHVNTKHRLIRKKKMKMESGARLTWWNIDRGTDRRTIVIVEGEIDLLTLIEVGIPNVVSLPNGAQTGTMSFFNDIDWDRFDTVYMAGDMDEPGEACMNECAARIGKEKCWRVRWPEKDANETLMQGGPDAVHEAFDKAQPYPIEGIEQPGDDAVREAVLRLYRDGMKPGLSTGWQHLDQGYTISTAMLDIWGGYPGSGKSELLDALVINLGVLHDWRFAMFSPENYPSEFHIEKLARKFTDKPFKEGATERMTEEELNDAIDWLDQHIHFLRPEMPTVDEIIRLAKIEKRRFGINAITIDPWNTMIHVPDAGEVGTEYIGKQLTKLRMFGRQHDVRVTVCAHPRKPPPGTGAMVPGPNDAAGSYNFFAMADSMLAVGRNKQNPDEPVQMHIQKVRHRHLGKEGVCKFRWSPVTGRYEDISFETGGLIL